MTELTEDPYLPAYCASHRLQVAGSPGPAGQESGGAGLPATPPGHGWSGGRDPDRESRDSYQAVK